MCDYQQLSWQQQLSSAFHQPQALCEYLGLDVKQLVSLAATEKFALRVPHSFAARMEKGNLHDPLLQQVLPIAEETQNLPGFTADPVGDLAAMTEVGVIHKYHGRALLMMTGSCAIHCRYCFRRNFPYHEFQLSKQKQQDAVRYLQQHSELSEIILSGGDPLLLSDVNLAQLIQQLDTVTHLKRLRIHTRLPIVLPARITKEFIAVLQQTRLQIIIVVHCNHAQELNEEVRLACIQLQKANIVLLNQSVLLKNINHNVMQLAELSEKLISFGILPYYLHILDKAIGTGHFEVSPTDAVVLIRELQTRLPGYLVPKLAHEEMGKAAKTLLF